MGPRKQENESRQKSNWSLVAQLTVMKHTLFKHKIKYIKLKHTLCRPR
jgi:hypothetical protein